MRNWQICPELTNMCNMACVLCPHSVEGKPGRAGNMYDRKPGIMSADMWVKCLETAGKYARELSLGFFGEQTMHPSFSQFISMIPLKRRYKVVLNTNWSYISRTDFPVLIMMVDEVRISLDAIKPETYARICNPKGSFYDVGGRTCCLSRDYLPAVEEKILDWIGNPHPKTKLIFTISSYNVFERRAFIAKWRSLLPRQDSVCVKSCISFGGVMKNPLMRRAKCTIPREKRMMIAHDGKCSPCNLDVNMALNVGDIGEVGDMMQIVRGSRYRAVMAGIKRKQGICRNCFDGNNRRLTHNYRGIRCAEK